MKWLSLLTVAELLAEPRLHRDAFASFGAAARKHLGSALGLHTSPEAVLFRALAPVGLKCAFGHEKLLLLIESTGLRQTKSINDREGSGKLGEGPSVATGETAPRTESVNGDY